MVNSNPGFLSTLATNPNTRIVDGTDNIHSGIINSLNIATGGNCVISGFNITQQDGGSYTQYSVASGKILRNGLLVSVSTATLSPTAGSRAGNDWYATIVIAANNSLAIRIGAKDIATAAVSTLTADDIPVAIVKYVAGSADDAVDRLVQFLGYTQSDRGFSVLDDGAETIRFNADGTVTKGGATLTLPSSTGTIALTSNIAYTSAISQGNAGLVPSGGVATANIADDAVTYAKMQNVSATNRILGRDSSGAGAVEEIAPSDVVTMLGIEAGATADQTDAQIETAYNNQVSAVSSSERSAGTSTAIRRFTPADIHSMIDSHQSDTNTNDDVSAANLKTALNSDFGSDFTIGSQSNDTATFSGHLTVGGNLTVSGSTTTISSNELAIGDNKIVLNTDVTGTPSQDSGIEVERGNATNVVLQWNEGTDRWQFTNDGSTFYNLPTTAELANPFVHPDSVVSDVDTSGATIIDSIATNATGHITAMGTRTLTLANLGYTGSTDANTYVHPNHSGDVTSSADGATTIASNAVTTGKIANNAVTASKINSGVITNSHLSSTAAIATSKVDGLDSALAGKEPSLTIENGLTRTGAALKININDASGGLSLENGMDRTADFLMYDDGSVTSGNPLRRINLANIFGKLVASDIPDISSAYRATGTALVNADISNSAAISADKIADGSSNKLFTSTLKTKLDGIAASATAGADWSSNVSNISVANSQLAGSIANNKLANSAVTINSNSVNLGGSITLDADDFAEGTNKFYTDERVDDRVNALITDGEGITTTYNDGSNTLTLAAELATTSNKGVASFTSDMFDVSSGVVSLKNGAIKDAQIASDATIAQSKIQNLTTNLASKVEDLSDLSITATATEINILDGVTGVSATEIGYLDGVTSAIQTQLNSKLSSVAVADLTDINSLSTSINANSTHTQLATAKAIKDFISQQQVEDRQYSITGITPDGGVGAHIKIASQLGDSDTLTVEGGTRINTSINQGRLRIDSATKGSVASAAYSQGILTLTHDDGTTTSATLPDSTTDAHGLMTDTQFDKLAGIEAQADVTDKANVVASLGLLNESDTLYLGDAGNDTTVRVRGNFFVDGTTTTINQTEINVQDAIKFEGATADAHETILRIVDPTDDRIISLPDITGTLITTGDTGTIATAMIANSAITTGKINSNAISTGKLATGAVTTAKITDANVTTAKLADDAVTGAKIDFIDDSIAATNTHIMVADGTDYNNVAVSGDATLANDGVLTIASNAITTAKINADAITSAKIVDNAINSEHYTDGSIDTAHIADDQVTYAKIQNVSATNRILGRDSSGAGIIEEIAPADVVTMLGIEANADVTDATNVNAAGAVMHTDIPDSDTGFVKRTGSETYDIDTNTYLTSLAVTGLSDIAQLEQNLASITDDHAGLATAKAVKAYVDSIPGGVGGMSFVLEDGDGTELTIADSKEIKFVPASSLLTINWTDVDNGTDADPYDLTFTVNPLLSAYTNDSNFTTTTALNNATAATAITGKVLTNLGSGTGGAIAAGDTILAAMQKLETRTALNDAKVTNTDINVNESNLRTRLADISSSFTIGDATDVTVTTSGALIVTGNLTVNGTTTTIDTNTVNIGDNIIVLNADATGSASQDAGIEIERGDDSNKTLIWDETNNKWTVGSETFVAGTFTGALTGDVTGNVSGNAGTATILQNARTIAGKSFNGSANITIATTDLSDISALDTDLSDVSANDDSLASAKAIKAYVDAQVDTEDTISELNDTTIGSLSAGELLIFNSTSGKWVNAIPTGSDTTTIDMTVTGGDGTLAISADLKNPDGLTVITDDGAGSTLTATGTDEMMVWDVGSSAWRVITLANLSDFAIQNGSGGVSAYKTFSVPDTGNSGPDGQASVVADDTADTLTLKGDSIAITTGTDLINFNVNIDGLSALGGTGLHQTQDHFMFSDNGTEKKITFSNLEDAIFANVSGDATIAAGGALTIASGAVENSMLAGSIANSKLANDSVSFGGVSLDLGQTDATPAFDLTDATNYPTSSLTGTITNAQLAGSIANAKLANSSITVSDGSNSTATALGGTITFAGTSNETTVAESSGTVTIGLPDDVTIASDLTLSDGKTEITQSDGSAHGLKVYRNDDSTSTPLVYFHDDHAFNDSPVLHVKSDRTDEHGDAAIFEGRVGIGTTSPVAPLTVETATNDVEALRVQNGAGNPGGVQGITRLGISSRLESVAGAQIIAKEMDVADYRTDMIFATKATNVSDDAVTERMIIRHDGKVGIGTTSPSTELDVNGTITATAMTMGNLKLRSTNEFETDSGSIHMQYNTGNDVEVGSTGTNADLVVMGRVGISPTTRLSTPDTTLHIEDDSTGLKTLLLIENTGSAGNSGTLAGLEIRNSAGTDSSTHIEQDAFGGTRFYTGQAAKNLFLTASADGTLSSASDFTVGGNLIVSGTTTTINTATVEVEDNILQLNTTQASPDTATAATSGISVYRGDGVTQASLIFDDGDDTWDLTNHLTVAGTITGNLTGNVTGNVSGTAATVTGAAQTNITSLGTLTALQVDNLNINANTISSTDTNGDITVTPNGTGDIVLDGQKWPQADGTANYVLKTDGSGQLSWGTAASASGGVALTGSTNNTLVTVTGAGAIAGEANLTFDGSTFTVAGNALVANNGSLKANGSGYLQLGNTNGGLIRLLGDGGTSRIRGDANHLQLETNRDNDDIIFAVNAGGTDSDETVVEAMRIVGSDGNIGIGTTSPSSKLQVVQDDAQFTIIAGADVNAQSLTDNTRKFMRFGMPHYDTDEQSFSLITGDSNDGVNQLYLGGGTGVGNAASNIFFNTAANATTTTGTTRMAITDDGKIGIGDTNPLALLHIEFAGGDTTTYANTNETYRNMVLLRNNTVTTNAFAGIAFDVSTESDFDSLGASIAAVRDTSASSTAGNHDANLVFATNDAGDDGNTERMRITHDGNVGIGTTSPSQALDVAGSINLTGDIFLAQEKKIQFDSGDTHITTNADNPEDLFISVDQDLFLRPDNDVLVQVGTTTYAIFDGGNQRVGIGTTSPQAPLHVVGNVMITNTDSDNTVKDSRILGRTYTNNDYNLIYGYADATTNRLYLGGGTGTGEPATDIIFHTLALNADTDASGTERMRILANGYVGIGTASPTFPLDVNGWIATANGIVHTGDTNNTIQFDTDIQKFNTAGTTRLTIAANGNVTVAGAFSAATKSFDIEHPTEEGKRLHHGSLEGPEHGVYIRGRLEGDTIELPDYWLGLVDEDTITVQLTPNKGFQQIYVDHIEDNKVYVGTQTDTPIDCFYFIQAERKDVDKMEVEYDAVV